MISDTIELRAVNDALFIGNERLKHAPIFDRPIPCLPQYMFENVQQVIWNKVSQEKEESHIEEQPIPTYFKPKTNPLVVFFPDFAPHANNFTLRNYLSEYDVIQCEDRQVRIPIGWQTTQQADGIMYRLHQNTHVVHVLSKKGYWRHYTCDSSGLHALPSAVLKNILAHQKRFKTMYLKSRTD